MNDITIFGATGFTGQLTADYLASRRKSEDFQLALAGRNRGKLQSLKTILEKKYSGSEIQIIISDVDEEPSIRKMTEDTRVLVNTVGPYLEYGEPVSRACAISGTHYLDLTGEGGYVQNVGDKLNKLAGENRARLIHCCGYDSIPADLGTYFTVKQLPENENKEIECFINMTSKNLYSSFQSISGGTWHSALGFLSMDELERQSRVYEKLKNNSHPRDIKPMAFQFHYREETGEFGIPLPFVDIEIVLRSAAYHTFYGNSFSYGHFLSLSGLPKFFAGIFGLSLFLSAAQLPLIKEFLKSIKSRGEGPDKDIRESNRFKHSFVGKSETKTVKTEICGGDPGYGDTSKMIGEAAICCLNDELPEIYGQVTTAQVFGDKLITRLKKYTGIEFNVV